ncbi:MAG: helix-turn-helix domain-containing protein [Acidimicrobiales bacterium]
MTTPDPAEPPAVDDTEAIVRTRLRSLRTTLGRSLGDLARQTNLSPSTISRIETGKRAVSLDVLVPLARALHVSLDELVARPGDDDVVIRPTPFRSGEHSAWMLSRSTASRVALRIRLTPIHRPVEPLVHPGHDWLYVIDGEIQLHLGDRRIRLVAGEAAEFDTMIPHAVTATTGPADVIMIVDRDGRRAHLDQPPG